MDYVASPSELAQEIARVLMSIGNTLYSYGNLAAQKIPGGEFVATYVRNSYQNDPMRTFVELCLIVFFVIYVLHHKRSRPEARGAEAKLTEREIDELVGEWEPEPLTPALDAHQREVLERVPVLEGPNALHVAVRQRPNVEVLNLASYNFLGLLESDLVKERAVAALHSYGVGTCGPPGFYGTLDVHMELEKALAQFVGTQEAILYSQGFSTISSAIPAFAKRGDMIFADAGVSFSVQKGLQLSRSHIHWFRHNDMDDCERVMRAADSKLTPEKRRLVRKFLVVEGVYENHGDVCPLPRLVELKEQFKCRLIVEESCSFGVLGATGRGVTEHFGVNPRACDAIVASLANAIGAAGGFCAGSSEVVDHQRLSGLAYCFSASMPALLAVAARENLRAVAGHDPNKSFRNALVAAAREFYSVLGAVSGIELSGAPDAGSPIVHVRLTDAQRASLGIADAERDAKAARGYNPAKVNFLASAFKGDPTRFGPWWQREERVWQSVVDAALQHNLLVTVARYIPSQEMFLPRPSLRLSLSAGLSRDECRSSAQSLAACIRDVLSA